MSEHMNGAAPCSCRPGRLACETPMLEIEAMATAIYVLGDQADSDKYGIRVGEAISRLAWMIRDRVLVMDRNLFPNSPVFDDNVGAEEAANG